MASTLNLDQSDGDVVAVFPSVKAARAYLTRTAEWALRLLDDLDGDPEAESYLGDSKPDLEDESEHDEPSLGSLDRQPQTRSYLNQASVFDIDLEGDGDGREADAEPSLGAAENHPRVSLMYGFVLDGSGNQSQWGSGGTDDRERDAGDEPEEENEHGSANDWPAGCSLASYSEPRIRHRGKRLESDPAKRKFFR